MSKLKLSVVVLFAFAFGALAGGWAMTWALGEFMLQPTATSQASSAAAVRVSALTLMRDGKFEDAAALLETMLDGDLISLGAAPKGKIDKQTADVIRRAAEYRGKFPRKSGDKNVDEAVDALLSQDRSNASTK
jgi:hypothetical protein